MRALSVSLVLAAIGSVSLAAPVTYDIDPRHAHVAFEADHFGGVSKWRGIISGANGKIVLDPEGKTGTVDLSLEPGTVLTGVADLETHLKSDEFFDVAKYPKATYKGTLTNFKDGAPTEVQGNLTLHGVTKPITITLEKVGEAQTQMGPRAGWDTTFTIKRSEFGMTTYQDGQLGDEVKVFVSIEGVREG